MKAASSLIQVIALSACFAVQMNATGEHMAGTRRALQTMEGASGQAIANSAAVLAGNSPLNRSKILHRT